MCVGGYMHLCGVRCRGDTHSIDRRARGTACTLPRAWHAAHRHLCVAHATAGSAGTLSNWHAATRPHAEGNTCATMLCMLCQQRTAALCIIEVVGLTLQATYVGCGMTAMHTNGHAACGFLCVILSSTVSEYMLRAGSKVRCKRHTHRQDE